MSHTCTCTPVLHYNDLLQNQHAGKIQLHEFHDYIKMIKFKVVGKSWFITKKCEDSYIHVYIKNASHIN